MASVRASIINQARTAASTLVAHGGVIDATDCPAIDQLVRCARLSEDAERTLDWAFSTLHAHSGDRADQLACQLVKAARAHLDAQRAAPQVDPAAAPAHTLAWI
jgi:hypothetical protein